MAANLAKRLALVVAAILTVGAVREAAAGVTIDAVKSAASFERNIGMGSPLKMPRGLNDLWTRGGLMYAPPLR
jgi:hypothetical protein